MTDVESPFGSPSDFLRKLLWQSDARFATACRGIFRSAPGLLIFAFHNLFASAEEVAQGLLDPQQSMTVPMFRAFIADFQNHGYRFVSPDEIITGLESRGRYATITFDDGYANNLRALPALEEFRTPAVFCISANHVLAGKPFWWDVLYREARKRSWSARRLERARAALKRLRTEDAEKKVITEFGNAAFHAVSDLDRPLTPSELRNFASHSLVHIGNHTYDHAILGNYSENEVAEQIQNAQQSLGEMTGKLPKVIAYPNGNVSAQIERAARDAGIRLGLTIRAGKNRIPRLVSTTPYLRLRRFTLAGDRDIQSQCVVARAPVSLQSAMSTIRARARAMVTA